MTLLRSFTLRTPNLPKQAMPYTLHTTALEEIAALPLSSGQHSGIEDGMCVMEAVAYVAGEPWSDRPACACPVISAFMRSWNDALPTDEDRDRLLRPLIATLVGTRSTPEVEQRRTTMAADWMIRVQTPAWLRLAHLDSQAAALESLPEITDPAQCPSLMPTLNAARRDATAAESAAWSAAVSAAWSAAVSAAWSAAVSAAVSATESATDATVKHLQASAVELVKRMAEVKP